MEAVFRKNWLSIIFERLVFSVILFLSGWLQEHSESRWHLIIRIREGVRRSGRSESQAGGSSDMARDTALIQQSVSEKGPESLDRTAFERDTPHKSVLLLNLPDWAREINPFLANQLSDHTRRAYETDLKQFLGFLNGRLDLSTLEALRPEHIILFRKAIEEGRLTGRPMSKATINRKLAVVKSFLNWLRANQLLKDNPAQLVKGYPQSQESSLRGLSDEEARRMLEIPDRNSKTGALHQAILHVLLYLGLRKGELIRLKIGDLDTERGIPVIRVRGKGHRVRILPLTKGVQASVDHYLWACRRNREEKDAPLFTPTKNPKYGVTLKHLNPNAITYIVVRYARKAGVLKNVSPHSCRATCISNALDRRATHRSVQHLAGWSTPLMIQRYDKRREDLANSAAFLIDYGDEEKASA